jgi:P-type conjugative transfer protein TrbJ
METNKPRRCFNRARRPALRVALALLLVLGLSVRPAHAFVYPVVDIPHTFETILHYIARMYEIAQKAQQIANQVYQIRYQVESLQRLRVRNWRDLEPFLNDVDRLFGSADNLAYSVRSVPGVWEETFPIKPYEEPLTEKLRAAQRTVSTMRTAVESLQRMQLGWYESQRDLRILKAQAESASTPQQTAETSVTLLAHMAEEVSSLRPALAVQANLLAASVSQTTAERYRDHATFRGTIVEAYLRTSSAFHNPNAYATHDVLPPYYPR